MSSYSEQETALRAWVSREGRRASWRRYAAKVARTPEHKAKRAAYMRDYRARTVVAAVTAVTA